MTIAYELQNMAEDDDRALLAFEKAYDIAISVSVGENSSDLRFGDGSIARVEVTEDHEIYIYEV